MEGEKTQKTIYTGPQATSDIYCGSYKIICLGPKRLMITQSFGKKAIFPVTNRIWPTLSRNFDSDKPHRTTSKSSKGNSAHYCGSYKINSATP